MKPGRMKKQDFPSEMGGLNLIWPILPVDQVTLRLFYFGTPVESLFNTARLL